MKGLKVRNFVVQDEKRFMTFISVVLVCLWTILMLLALTATTAFAEKIFVEAAASAEISKEEAYVNSFERVNVVIGRGDTAWSIQEKLTPNEDARKVLYHLEKINGKNMSCIVVGETLIFLKAK